VIELPDVAVPKVVAETAGKLAEREADLAAAKQVQKEARAGIDAAKAEDRAAFAAERDAGRPDPGAKHVEAARARLADAERVVEGETLRHERAQAALDEAIRDARDSWSAAVERTLVKSEAKLLAAFEACERAEQQRSRERQALDWLRRYGSGLPMPRLEFTPELATGLRRHPSDTGTFAFSELLAALRSAVEHARIEAETQRAAERERQEAEAEQRAAELRRLHHEVAGR
jgi:hypothetical protein